jgi:hypothetical protein
MSWSAVPIIGLIVGVLIMVFGFRKREQKPFVFEDIDGVLKQDWARTGNIDFHVGTPDSASPQRMILRAEEKRIIENAMGQDVIQLRWRLATLEEAKEVVVCWNASKPERQERREGTPSSA